jgi:molybdopterin-guanine dinucleotide biosynthesis protein A
MAEEMDFDALILAGGESRRMGRDKSLLPFAGTTLVEHIAAQLRPVAREVRISTADVQRHAHLGLELVPDLTPGLGPLMGIASGLRAASRDWTLVVATDIPVLPLALLPQLWALTAETPCVIPQTADGRVQPLFGLYHRRLADEILSFLGRGERRVLDFVAGCGGRILPAPDVKIANLNNHAEYEGLLKGTSTPSPNRGYFR